MSTATDYFLYILLRPMFYLMHEGQIGLGSNAKLISFLSNIQSVHSLIEYKEIQLFLNVINGNNDVVSIEATSDITNTSIIR